MSNSDPELQDVNHNNFSV
ncbi:hypothetical protein A2U01_0034205, partial [Trifolium medium]|nr:hypothetical protein [Trifolium medium]